MLRAACGEAFNLGQNVRERMCAMLSVRQAWKAYFVNENHRAIQRYNRVNVYLQSGSSFDDELNRTVTADIPPPGWQYSKGKRYKGSTRLPLLLDLSPLQTVGFRDFGFRD